MFLREISSIFVDLASTFQHIDMIPDSRSTDFSSITVLISFCFQQGSKIGVALALIVSETRFRLEVVDTALA